MNIESILIAAALLGLIPAAIAKGKGHSFLAWWICGAALFIIAFPASICIKPATGSNDITGLQARQKKCPFCAELIKPEARVCRFCGRDLPAPAAAAHRKPAPRYRFRKTSPAAPTYHCPGCNGLLTTGVLAMQNPICPHCRQALEVA
jgi:hypothetical protein